MGSWKLQSINLATEPPNSFLSMTFVDAAVDVRMWNILKIWNKKNLTKTNCLTSTRSVFLKSLKSWKFASSLENSFNRVTVAAILYGHGHTPEQFVFCPLLYVSNRGQFQNLLDIQPWLLVALLLSTTNWNEIVGDNFKCKMTLFQIHFDLSAGRI